MYYIRQQGRKSTQESAATTACCMVPLLNMAASFASTNLYLAEQGLGVIKHVSQTLAEPENRFKGLAISSVVSHERHQRPHQRSNLHFNIGRLGLCRYCNARKQRSQKSNSMRPEGLDVERRTSTVQVELHAHLYKNEKEGVVSTVQFYAFLCWLSTGRNLNIISNIGLCA